MNGRLNIEGSERQVFQKSKGSKQEELKIYEQAEMSKFEQAEMKIFEQAPYYLLIHVEKPHFAAIWPFANI